ncbi:RimJ/RimL family protein N-acetyltransferase [Friedmanniella endophytica]|uniref:RimJ/RimL family protein N-acetyltransferase n=2 Tax=Microlunatus kandeliicorticis TaxID=1759536 RepID=A0A7W3IS36_9ACTN|nr:RimJ/RimL family protein N-acetyltransferase [Microlunatus kandeliicorticis]
MIAGSVLSRELTGLGSWAVRVVLDGTPGPVIGTAGCTVLDADAWNLGYRFGPDAWGHGYASEAATAALDAAHRVRPDLPVTARALTSNPASLRVLARIGLVERWRGRSDEAAVADPTGALGVQRVVVADRELSDQLLTDLIALG